MTNLESYKHSADSICGCYFELDADEMNGAIDLDELLGWANYDGFYHSVIAYIELKYPKVYEDYFCWEDE